MNIIPDLNKNSYCISIDQNKYLELCKNFKRFGLNIPQLVDGIKTTSPDHNYGASASHVKVLKMAIQMNLPYIVIFEDDAYPCLDVVNKFSNLLTEIQVNNIDFGCLVLGRNGEGSGWNGDFCQRYHDEITLLPKEKKPFCEFKTRVQFLSDNIIRIPKVIFGAHSYIVKHDYFQVAIDRFQYSRFADVSLAYDKLNTIASKECLFIQKNTDGSYYYPTYYNECYMGGIYQSKKLPIGFV